MLALKNNVADMEELFSMKKKLILYGAGASCELILQAYYEQGLREKVPFIVDRNEELDGKECVVSENIKVKILSLNHFIREWQGRMEQFIMLMTPYHSLGFIPQLDEIKELDGLNTYLFSMIVNKKLPGEFPLRSLDRPVIPKKIHYIWIGEKELPEEDRRNIESWRRFCPDYEIRLWNEENYDFNKNRYVHDAVMNRQYMYATDYVRKDILYCHGGIYLDTDVELLAPIDDLLYNEAFIGIEDGGQLNSGSGLGAVAGHPLMKELRDLYEDIAFIGENGRPNYHYNTYYETKFMLNRGFQLRNKYQNIDGMICFPREVLMPEGVVGLRDTYTERTLANHKINPYDKTERRKLLKRAGEEDKRNTAPFHIYGTGIVGVSVYAALQTLHNVTPVSFLVTDRKNNPTQIEQITVQEAAGASLGEDLILVAAPVEHHESIGAILHDLGVPESLIIYVDSALENRIMEKYYASLPGFETAGQYLERRINAGKVETSDIKVYQAKCHVDCPLVNEAEAPAYIYPIQVGAALTEQSVADLKDNTGDHISQKNRDYCELTATYYAWKNSAAAYKGLCHYRRVFALNDADIEQLLGVADVILPFPTIHLPDISRQHSRYISEPEWFAMRRAVEECEPAYAEEFDRIFSDRYFYNFNMLAAKAEVFDDYARWLFGILERTEELIAEESIVTTKRYAGYLGENLTTLYFRRNRDRLRIVHAGKLQLI